MNWRRIKRGSNPKHCKEWQGGRGGYKIIWRDQVQGVSVPPAFHTLHLEITTGGEFWEMLDRSRPLKRTLKAAKRACENHANPPKTRKKRMKKNA
jgi:hypothetical protein